jgi:hypothetical protein
MAGRNSSKYVLAGRSAYTMKREKALPVRNRVFSVSHIGYAVFTTTMSLL